MKRDEIDESLTRLAFDFFFWFSRFEFALKECSYLESKVAGVAAKPGWAMFMDEWRDQYKLSKEAQRLIQLAPERQIIGGNGGLDWEPVGLNDCKYDLEKVVRLLKTVRNNLFHGGKHGGAGWDDKERTRELLLVGRKILDQLAQIAGIEGDYRELY